MLLLSVLILLVVGVVVWFMLRPTENTPDAPPPSAEREQAAPAVSAPEPASPAKATPRTSAEKPTGVSSAPPRRRMSPARHRARLLEIMRKLREARQAAGSESAPTGSAAPADPSKPGKLSRDYIKGALGEITPLIKECYHNALASNPGLGGRIVVQFEIVGDSELGGLVAESKIDPERSQVTSPGLEECVRETMYALELKAPEGGGKVKVSMPYTFRTKASRSK